MATLSESPSETVPQADSTAAPENTADITRTAWNPTPALVTVYSFPSMTPLRFEEYSSDNLLLPLRKDLLHRAVIYEGDKTRQGTASTKWRDDVRGSGRKLAPQKGTGNARVGDKKSPIRRGGGVAHGPHPRDFSTGLPLKIYDKAWRTALSYRYGRGQLMVVDSIRLPRNASPWFWKNFFHINRWGKGNGRCTFITEQMSHSLFHSLEPWENDARVLDRSDVDVKDLLTTSRLVIEKSALDKIIRHHSSDVAKPPPKAFYPEGMYLS
jgi:large subunit ribosomal protein L4